MNLINRHKPQPQPEPETDTAALQELARTLILPPDRHDEAERATECAEKAAALRATVAGTVQAAQDRYAAAEQEAARILGDASSALREAQQRAATVEREAAGIADTGRAYEVAAQCARNAQEARTEAERLAAERRDHLGTADALAARLDALRAQQKAAETALETAKAAVDVEAAGQAQQRLAGITAVIPTLAAQHDDADARARAIGTEESGGTYAQSLARIAAFTAERERALDAAEPERVQARREANPVAALLDDIAALPPAKREEILGSWFAGQQAEQPVTAVQGSASGARTAVVRRNA